MDTKLAKTLKKIASDEAKLQARKNAARKEALDTINGFLAVFQFKESELKFGEALKVASKATAKVKKARKPVAPKYRTPTGETWTGRGKQPKAIKAAIEQGHSLESMLIKA